MRSKLQFFMFFFTLRWKYTSTEEEEQETTVIKPATHNPKNNSGQRLMNKANMTRRLDRV